MITIRPAAERGQTDWGWLASKDGRDGSIQVHQDVALWMTRLRDGQERAHALAPAATPGSTWREARSL